MLTEAVGIGEDKEGEAQLVRLELKDAISEAKAHPKSDILHESSRSHFSVYPQELGCEQEPGCSLASRPGTERGCGWYPPSRPI